jgi:hypothetical protein
VSLVFGYRSPEGLAKLWSTNENLVTESTTFATAGIGAMYANVLMNRLFLPMWPMNHRQAVLLAAYVIYEVKNNIEGCGKDTEGFPSVVES